MWCRQKPKMSNCGYPTLPLIFGKAVLMVYLNPQIKEVLG